MLQMSRNSADHVFITFAQSGDMTRESLKDLLVDYGASGCYVVQETHQDGASHLHAACFGKFRRDRLAKDLHRAIPNQHINVLFAHKPKPGKTSGAPWPLLAMVEYLHTPAKDKHVDEEPLIWVDGEELVPNADAFVDLYEERFASDSVKGIMQKLREAKANNATLNDAISTVLESTTKDTGFAYRGLVEFFQTLPKVPMPLTPEGEEPRGWQVPVVTWALSPCPTGTDGRGMWLHQDSGAGKTWVINYIADQLPQGIFRPGLRPHGGYDAISMMHYNNEPLILLDDIGCSTRDGPNGETINMWKGVVMDFLKLITSNAPMAFDFGGKRYEVTPRGRVLVTSNFNLPPGRHIEDGAALRRRYLELSADSAEAVANAINGVPGNGMAEGFNPINT